ncbi:helix-turn-helix domain-containing protein [Myroides sp. N17-2]|uniref:helix-turn-helix domain-containing protein n=1 Tax=Myroides sp. N17-2 TaxID=2030799 RepID=UPI000EFCFB51|nr:helix-turn-helix domain-containing protein [Myroides sp. N17-2]
MHYQEIIPIKPLQGYVRYFWVLEDMSDNVEAKDFKIIPDGIPALIFQDRPNQFFDGNNQAMPQLYVYGQFNTYTNQTINSNFRIIGAYLEPTALKTLFGIDAVLFNNLNIPLEDIVTEPILERLVNAISVEEKIEIIARFLLNLVQEVKYKAEKANFATSLLQRGQTLKEVQLEMNLSERTLERLIKEYVGMTPKVYSRIVRFQSSLDLLRQADFKSLTELTYQSEYFDQSHFIREFKEFTGTSPRSFLFNTEEQLPNFPKINR